MTANEFFWWVVERRCGLAESAVRADAELMAAVEREADRRSDEVVERVLAVLRTREGDPTHHPADGRRLLTAGEGLTAAGAARRLGCSPSKVYRLFDAGELRGHRVGDKRVIDPSSVEEYKARHTNSRLPAPAPPAARKSGFRHLKLPPRV